MSAGLHLELCLFGSSPDIHERGFVVSVLTGTAGELAERSLAWGYDGFEYMPNPDRVPDPAEFRRTLQQSGARLPVVNTGRMIAHGLPLFHSDRDVAARSLEAFRRILDFAAGVEADVGLGIARGRAREDLDSAAMHQHAEDLFCQLADHAVRAGTRILLEPAETNVTRFILDLQEVVNWSQRINSLTSAASPHRPPRPAHAGPFGVMIDTHQLMELEPSMEEGMRRANGRATHLHLFDPERSPPGTHPRGIDWTKFFSLLTEQRFRGSASVTLSKRGDSPAEVAEFVRRHAAGASRQ